MIDGRRKRRPGEADAGHDLPADERTAFTPVLTDEDRPPEPPPATKPAEAPTSAGDGGKRGFRFNLGARLVRLGVKADHVTVLGVLIAGLTGAAIALGHLWTGAALLTTGGLMDTLDGAVAKAAGSASKRGAFFDSVTDRVADGFIFGGLAWYFAAGPGKDPGLALLPFGILAVSNVISYERAKAESLGWVAKGGLMERAERLILLGIALAANIVLVPLLWALFALCCFTAAQRFLRVWRQATADTGVPLRQRAWGPARVESRWREWRAASTAAKRPRVATRARVRARRRDEPLSTRVRRMLSPETVGAARTGRDARPGRQRRTHARDGAAAWRRRLGSGR